MLTQIWSATDNFRQFRPIFALLLHYWPQKLKFGKNVKSTKRYHPFTHMHNKSRSYYAWFLRNKVQKAKFFVILGYFLPFDPPNNWKSQNFEKMTKTPRDIIILHMSTIYKNQMMYDSWEMEHDKDSFFSFWTNFYTPPPPPLPL